MNASIDSNGTRTLTAALNTNGSTIIRIKASPTKHGLYISDGTTGSDHGPSNALHDENCATTLIAVSSVTATVGGVDYIQGVTSVVVYADSNGHLLVDHT
jgi:hypothetical protein